MKALAQLYADEAIAAFAEIVRDKAASAIACVKAAEALLNRSHGRPTQHVETRISPLEELSDDELASGSAALRAALVH